MEKTNEPGADEAVEESLDLPEVPEGQDDSTDWKAEAQKLREKAIAQRERTKSLKQQAAEAKAEADKAKAELARRSTNTPSSSKTGELDETALDYLDLKGVTESDDIKVIEDIVKKTGMTVRQALKDEYVTAKLTANKANREVKDATPSSTKRSGGNQGTDLATAIAKYEQSGFDAKTLPDDFKLRSAIVNAVAAKQNTNKPSWH